jgi:hypothetical protein
MFYFVEFFQFIYYLNLATVFFFPKLLGVLTGNFLLFPMSSYSFGVPLNKLLLVRNIIGIVEENICKFNVTLNFENISQNVPFFSLL